LIEHRGGRRVRGRRGNGNYDLLPGRERGKERQEGSKEKAKVALKIGIFLVDYRAMYVKVLVVLSEFSGNSMALI